MHTAIYARVSTEEQATEGFSIHAQKDKLTKYAESNDWIITDYYVDDGISGKNLTERPEVTRLIEDVKSGKINNVLVYKLDRLTRNVKDLIYLIELFNILNIIVLLIHKRKKLIHQMQLVECLLKLLEYLLNLKEKI